MRGSSQTDNKQHPLSVDKDPTHAYGDDHNGDRQAQFIIWPESRKKMERSSGGGSHLLSEATKPPTRE